MIDAYFKARGVEPPPLHVTNQNALQLIAADRVLELHAGAGASWSLKGTLREGDVAIRAFPGAGSSRPTSRRGTSNSSTRC